MARKGIFDRLREVVTDVQHENRQNPNEETATESLFEKLLKQVEIAVNNSKKGGAAATKSEVNKTIDDFRKANQKNPNEKTAPKSIFDKLKDKLGKEMDQEAKYQQKEGSSNIVIGGQTAPTTHVDDAKKKAEEPVDFFEKLAREAEAKKQQEAAEQASKKSDIGIGPTDIFDRLNREAEEKKRQEAAEAARRQAEAERQRRAAAVEAQRQAELERQRREAEEIARKHAEIDRRRREAEEAARRQAEAERQRLEAEAAARRQAEANSANIFDRLKIEAEENKRREAEAARKRAETDSSDIFSKLQREAEAQKQRNRTQETAQEAFDKLSPAEIERRRQAWKEEKQARKQEKEERKIDRRSQRAERKRLRREQKAQRKNVRRQHRADRRLARKARRSGLSEDEIARVIGRRNGHSTSSDSYDSSEDSF